MFLSTFLGAQKHDYLWLLGSNLDPPDTSNIHYSISQMDFNVDPVATYRRYRPLAMETSSAFIASKEGTLQIYANGYLIYNQNDQQMPNGFGLNPGAFQNYPDAYPSVHGAMIIPKPGDDSVYCMFHTAWKEAFTSPWLLNCNRLCCTTIDMRLEDGLGDVTFKNDTLIEDTLIGGGGMAACKHANGRDWWIIMQEMRTTCFYKYLLTPAGIDTMGKQCIGDTVHFSYDRGSNAFSPDGSKYVWSNLYENLNILDFDRCSGEFSNYERVKVADSILDARGAQWLDGVAISPNSRFLYLTTLSQLRQFDLWADTVAKSEIVIDNSLNGSPKSSYLFSQLAPNGKIYLNVANDTFMHVINNPDLPGFACGYIRNGVDLPTYNQHYLPYYPNYRLGPLTGSSCDSLPPIISGLPKNNLEQHLKVFPNPATDYITIDYGFTDWNKGEATLEITNQVGQVVHQQPLPMYSGFQKVEVSQLAAGVYTAFIKRGVQVVSTAKFAKQ